VEKRLKKSQVEKRLKKSQVERIRDSQRKDRKPAIEKARQVKKDYLKTKEREEKSKQ
jgi:hypothetical protein